MTATKVPKEKIIDKIDTAIYKLPNSPKIELGDTLLNALSTGAEDILVDDYLSDKTIQEKTIEQLKDECKFDQVEDAFDEGLVPHQLEFFVELTMKILFKYATFCLLMKITMSLCRFCLWMQAKIWR